MKNLNKLESFLDTTNQISSFADNDDCHMMYVMIDAQNELLNFGVSGDVPEIAEFFMNADEQLEGDNLDNFQFLQSVILTSAAAILAANPDMRDSFNEGVDMYDEFNDDEI